MILLYHNPLSMQAQVCKISVFPHLHLWAKHVQSQNEKQEQRLDRKTGFNITWLWWFCLWKMDERSLCPKKKCIVPFGGLQAKTLLTSKSHLKLKHWLNELQSSSSEYTSLYKICKNLFQTLGSKQVLV